MMLAKGRWRCRRQEYSHPVSFHSPASIIVAREEIVLTRVLIILALCKVFCERFLSVHTEATAVHISSFCQGEVFFPLKTGDTLTSSNLSTD